MEREQGMAISGEAATALGERTGPSWRGFALSILVAVVLSVMATLLFGGSWSSFTLSPSGAGSSNGCAPCCPPPDSGK